MALQTLNRESMNKNLKNIVLAGLLGVGGIATANAGLLTYQGVTFASSWSGKVLTLEIDAAAHTGDWTKAKGLAALELNGIGNYSGVTVTTAPNGVTGWTTSSSELNAGGCSGDTNGQAGSRLCFYGQQVALADNMVFSFTFSGNDIQAVDPHVKVEFVNGKGRKVGSLLSQTLPASPNTATATGGTGGTGTGTGTGSTGSTAGTTTTGTTTVTTTGTTTGTQSATSAATQPAVQAPIAATAPPTVTGTPVTPPIKEIILAAPMSTDTGTAASAATSEPLVEIPLQAILSSADLPPAVPARDAAAPLQTGADTAIETGGTGPAAVPEPQSIALLLAGLGMMGLAARRKRRG